MVKIFNKLLILKFLLKSNLRHRLLLMYKFTHRCFVIGSENNLNVPLHCQGVGTVTIGNRNSFGYHLAPSYGNGAIMVQARNERAKIVIGDENYFSNNVSIIANEEIVIGDRCQFGEMITIYDCDFHEISPETRNHSHGNTNPVRIGNNVWLGSRVIVLKGVSIGDNSIVAAASVVTKSIPKNTIAAGNPAIVIRQI